MNLKNADIDVLATRNALRPSLTEWEYSSVGLAGNSPIKGTAVVVSSGVPIVDANGNPITVDVGGVATPIFQPVTVTSFGHQSTRVRNSPKPNLPQPVS